MMKTKSVKLATVAPIALCAFAGSPLWAGTFDDAPVLDVLGDGYVFSDEAEGILEPGLKAITTDVNADYPNTFSPSGMENCLMANNPDFVCTAPPGAGKRIKTRLTGPDGMEIRLSTEASGGITEYYFYGKTSNLTGARIQELELELGTGTGEDFTPMDPTDPLVAALFDEDYNPKFNLPDGLFGGGGQETTGIGFFDENGAQMTVSVTNPSLTASDLFNATFQTYFGDALLDNSMIPDAYFWDASSTVLASDEPILLAWYNVSSGEWLYGNLGVDTPSDPDVVPLADRLAVLADSLGVTVADLGYGSGGDAIPAEIVAAMEADDLFAIDVIEDLRNLNLNFIVDLGDVAGNEVTLRLTPVFAPLVEEAQSPYQFITAARLDAAANVPYLDLGNSAAYQGAITDILALDAAEQAEALERTGFSFLSAFNGLGFEFGRSQVLALGSRAAEISDEGATLSTKGEPNSWSMGEGVYGFMSLRGAAASYDSTANGIGYDIGSVSVSAGMEKQLSSTKSIGFMVGGADGTADVYNGRGEIDASSMSVAAFGRTSFGKGGTLQAVLGYQSLSYDTSREVMGLTADGNTDGSQVFGAVRGDYMFQRDALTFGPTASVEFYDLSVDAFDETGAGAWNLSIGEQSGEVVVASIGLRGDYKLPNASSDSHITASVSYNSASGDDKLIQSGFVGLPGASTPVDGFDREWADLYLGFSTKLGGEAGRGTLLQTGYLGSFGSDYENHSLQLSVKMSF